MILRAFIWAPLMAAGVGPAPALAGEASPNWLDRLFPSIAACTPSGFYFDEKAGKSVPGILEARGYKPVRITPETAEYAIDERFHGLRAVAILVPNHMDVLAVTLEAPARKVRATLEKAYGEKLARTKSPPPGHAYLYSKQPDQTVFVCLSEPE